MPSHHPPTVRSTADRNINTLRNTTLAQNLVASDAATDVITIAGGHSLVDGDVVAIRTITGLANGQAYYVINATGTTLQLSATSGGTAANVTTSGAAGFMTAGLNLNGQTLGTYGILNGSSEPLAIGGGSGSSVTLPTTTSGNLHVTNGNASVWIDAPITDNGAGVLTLVKGGTSGNGSGNVTLSGNNTYTGGTVVNSGNITLSGTNTFATGSAGADVINGGSLTYSTLAAWGGTGRNVTFNGTGTLTSTVVGYSGGALTSNAGANATIVSTNNGAAGSTQISFATTTGAGNVIYSTGNNRLLNLGDASGLTGNLQARLTGNAGYGTATTVQFSSIGDAVGSALQFAGGTSDRQSSADRRLQWFRRPRPSTTARSKSLIVFDQQLGSPRQHHRQQQQRCRPHLDDQHRSPLHRRQGHHRIRWQSANKSSLDPLRLQHRRQRLQRRDQRRPEYQWTALGKSWHRQVDRFRKQYLHRQCHSKR